MSRIRVENISFAYKGKTVLHSVSFELHGGEIVGVLGENGAGKSSLLKLLSGLFVFQKGSVFFDEKKVASSGYAVSNKLRSQMGVVFQECSLDLKLSAFSNLQLSGKVYGLSNKSLSGLIESELDYFQLKEVQKQKVSTFSGGMKRRLELLRGLLHDPGFLLMDEPSVGLDPLGFKMFWDRLYKRKNTKQKIAMLVTHKVEEAQNCDRLLILHKGKLIAEKTPEELKSMVDGDKLDLTFLSAVSEEDVGLYFNQLSSQFEELKWKRTLRHIQVVAKNAPHLVPRVVELLPKHTLESVSVKRPTVADGFLKLTGAHL